MQIFTQLNMRTSSKRPNKDEWHGIRTPRFQNDYNNSSHVFEICHVYHRKIPLSMKQQLEWYVFQYVIVYVYECCRLISEIENIAQ